MVLPSSPSRFTGSTRLLGQPYHVSHAVRIGRVRSARRPPCEESRGQPLPVAMWPCSASLSGLRWRAGLPSPCNATADSAAWVGPPSLFAYRNLGWPNYVEVLLDERCHLFEGLLCNIRGKVPQHSCALLFEDRHVNLPTRLAVLHDELVKVRARVRCLVGPCQTQRGRQFRALPTGQNSCWSTFCHCLFRHPVQVVHGQQYALQLTRGL